MTNKRERSAMRLPKESPNETPASVERVHIIGVGGSATRGLACFLSKEGFVVSGSDQESEAKELLEGHGIQFYQGHDRYHLSSDIQTVIHTRAIGLQNPELLEAKNRSDVKIYTYSEYLGLLSKRFRTIAVAGTHGKTSTTACLFSVFQAAGRDPSMIVGGEVAQVRAGWHRGKGEDFLVEACEFEKAFLDLKPSLAIITNIDLDHPEVYSNLESVIETFREFVGNLAADSWVICPVEVKEALKSGDRLRWRTFGTCEKADVQLLTSTSGNAQDLSGWKLANESSLRAHLQVPGAHTRLNASAVIALAEVVGVPEDEIVSGLEKYRGVARRFERRDVLPEVEWIEDYAHHPEEVRATIATAREVYPDQKCHILFQPHQATRLHAFMDAFAKELSAADQISLLPIYSVRENLADFPGGLIDQLAAAIRGYGKKCDLLGFEEAVSCLPEKLESREVLVSIGAGDVHQIGRRIREQHQGQVLQ